MTRQVIVVSDLSGEPIENGKAWTMTLTAPDGRRNPIRLDLSDAEAQEFAAKGTEIKRRGRRPDSKNAPRGGGTGARAARSEEANAR